MKELDSEGAYHPEWITVAAYGMSTEPGKAKVNFYRGERFEISGRLLREPELVKIVGDALRKAEELRSELWVAQAKLATHILAGDSDNEGGRKPDPKDVRNLVAHWNAEGLYWSRMEAPFHRFMHDLPNDPEAALSAWEKELRSAAVRAYRQTTDGLGDSQKAFKAVAKTSDIYHTASKKFLDPPSRRFQCNIV